MHAERCPKVGRDPTLPRSVLGFHVVDFPFFLPNAETPRSRLERVVRVLARQRGVVVRSSPACDLATVLGRRPRTLGVRVTPPHPLRLAPNASPPSVFYSPPGKLDRRVGAPTRSSDESTTSLSAPDPRWNRHLSCARERAGGHADYVLTHYRLHGRRTKAMGRPPACTRFCTPRLTHARDRPARRWIAMGRRL